MKHVWINKRTPKGVKPVREWIECKTCGADTRQSPRPPVDCPGAPK